MAIVKMSKFNLIAFASERSEILKNLQKFKEVHFVDIELDISDDSHEEKIMRKISDNESLTRIEERLNGVANAISLIRKYHIPEKGIRKAIKGNSNYTFAQLMEKVGKYDWKKTYLKLRDLGTRLNQLSSEISKKYSELENISLWKRLDINPQDLKKLKRVKTYIGTVPSKLKSQFIEKISNLENTYYEELNSTKEDVYYLVITLADDMAEEEKLREVFRTGNFAASELNIDELPARHIEHLKNEIAQLKDEKEKIKVEIKSYDNELESLEAVYEYLKNKKLRITESEKMARTRNIFAINGWVPTDKQAEIVKYVEEAVGEDYYISFAEAEKDDPEVPIKLKNNRVVRTFESLTGMYAYPKYNEIDPTPLLTPFYIVFFGMMGADAGYGLVLMLATLFLLKFVNLNRKMRLFTEFFLYLSISVIIWGILYGSYFGLEIPGMWRLVNPASEFQKLLIGSIAFGLVQLFFGLAVKAYLNIRDGKPLDALYDVGFWYMALGGGIVYLMSAVLKFSSTVSTVSMWIMVIGMAGIVLTGGRDSKSIGGKLGGGLYSLYGISSYVGDFVSYSRLMALGLAGGFIAQAMNIIAGMLGRVWWGLIFVPVIFVFGHLFNMFLSFLAAYVHTSRLMYVEFFGKFYEGGGKPFKEFRTESRYINIED